MCQVTLVRYRCGHICVSKRVECPDRRKTNNNASLLSWIIASICGTTYKNCKTRTFEKHVRRRCRDCVEERHAPGNHHHRRPSNRNKHHRTTQTLREEQRRRDASGTRGYSPIDAAVNEASGIDWERRMRNTQGIWTPVQPGQYHHDNQQQQQRSFSDAAYREYWNDRTGHPRQPSPHQTGPSWAAPQPLTRQPTRRVVTDLGQPRPVSPLSDVDSTNGRGYLHVDVPEYDEYAHIKI